MRTYDELISGIKELKEQGFIKTLRPGDTGVGQTLEQKLGIAENNFPGPDGKDTELKGARRNSPSMLTLFTKSPLPRGINSKLRQEYGYPDEKYPDKMILCSTVNSVDFNSIKKEKGFVVTSNKDRIELQHYRKPQKFPDMENAYWLKETIEKSIKKKYKKHLLYVKADSRGTSENEEFHYNEAYLLEGFDFEKFSKNLKAGILKVDLRMDVDYKGKNTGKVHDHGTGFRIMPSMLDKIFSGKRVV